MNLHVDDVCPDFELKVTQDNRLNTIKGFIFGYYLGVSKSVSASSAKLLRIQKRIYDIAASIKNSGGYGTNSFYDELELLDKEYRLNDPSTRKCKELWEKTLKDLSIPSDSLNKLLETYDEKSVLKNTFMRKNGLHPPVSLRQYGFNNIEAYGTVILHFLPGNLTYPHSLIIIYTQITPNFTSPSQVSLLITIAYCVSSLGRHSGDLNSIMKGYVLFTCRPLHFLFRLPPHFSFS